MIVLSLSDSDVNYISQVLEREGKKLLLSKLEGKVLANDIDSLIKRNSGIYEVLSARLVPYQCHIHDLDTGEVNIVTFQQFETYFGSFPIDYNEAQIMQHIMSWCQDNGYKVEFKRKSVK